MTLDVRAATQDDTRYVVSLMRANRESVGGLPVPAIHERIQRGTVLLASVDGEPVGYVLFDFRGGVIRIPQACNPVRRSPSKVRDRPHAAAHGPTRYPRGVASLRRRPRGQRVLARHGVHLRRVGSGRVSAGAARSTCGLAGRSGDSVSLSELSVSPAAEIRVDAMYDDSGYLTRAPAGFKDALVLPKLAWSNRAMEDGPKVLTLGLDTHRYAGVRYVYEEHRSHPEARNARLLYPCRRCGAARSRT